MPMPSRQDRRRKARAILAPSLYLSPVILPGGEHPNIMKRGRVVRIKERVITIMRGQGND